jgi:hypothetical protein
MGLWSNAKLRNGVSNWKDITPEPLHKAIAALRKEFATNAWKAGEIMRQGCHSALHKGMADQARTINDGIRKLGYPTLPTVDEGQTESTVFTAYFDRSADLLAKEVSRTFSELFDIASANLALLNRDPVDWASLQTKVLVADESHLIPIWTKYACDKQAHDPSGAFDEAIHWRKWRAPKWLLMQPFANWPYDQATAWERMDEHESKELLEGVENRFNLRLIMALEKAIGETHIRLAKQKRESPPKATAVIAKPPKQVTSESITEGEHGNRPKADLWRDFHEKFEALADEEGNEGAAQGDCFLSAYCSYREHPEVWEKGKPEQGLFCLLKSPDTGVWTISDGVSEHFQARFRALASWAGIALGAARSPSCSNWWRCSSGCGFPPGLSSVANSCGSSATTNRNHFRAAYRPTRRPRGRLSRVGLHGCRRPARPLPPERRSSPGKAARQPARAATPGGFRSRAA